jgi:hypothetical protein
MPLAADEWLELEINDIHSPVQSANRLLHLHATGVYVRVSHRLSALEKEGQEEPLEREAYPRGRTRMSTRRRRRRWRTGVRARRCVSLHPAGQHSTGLDRSTCVLRASS